MKKSSCEITTTITSIKTWHVTPITYLSIFAQSLRPVHCYPAAAPSGCQMSGPELAIMLIMVMVNRLMANKTRKMKNTTTSQSCQKCNLELVCLCRIRRIPLRFCKAVVIYEDFWNRYTSCTIIQIPQKFELYMCESSNTYMQNFKISR